jgi:multicomponent K+:H+ antiporter subunit D
VTDGAAWLAAPVLLPLLAGAALLVAERAAPRWQFLLALAATLAGCAVALKLFLQAGTGSIDVYLLGNWPAPYGITFVLDRLSALMLLLTAALALPGMLYGEARFASRAPHFRAFFQLELAGLNGAFLTADLFNLFVCFELLLIASYALLLHAAGPRALATGFRYVVVNLVGSSLFLVAVSLLYGVTGTLNLADLAARAPTIPAESVGLLRAAALMLLVVFAIKAAIVPLGYWLPGAYAAAPAPATVLFALMTKVGVYAVLRVGSVAMSAEAGPLARLGQEALFVLGIVTTVVAAIGAWSARRLGTLAAFLVMLSAGTLVAAISIGSGTVLPGVLYYAAHSTFAGALLFLLADAIGHQRGAAGDALVAGPPAAQPALLGGLFLLAAAANAGLPPLPGFIGKFSILEGALGSAQVRWLWAGMLAGGLAATIALARAGSRLFWNVAADPAAKVRLAPLELCAIAALAAYSIGLVVFAAPAQRYAAATAAQLLAPRDYIGSVLGATPAPPLELGRGSEGGMR